MFLNYEHHRVHNSILSYPPTPTHQQGQSIINEDVLFKYLRLLKSDSGKSSLCLVIESFLYAVSSDEVITNSTFKGRSALACATWKIEERDWKLGYLFFDIT